MMSTVKQLAKKAEQALNRIGKERDKLRLIKDEVDELLYDTDEAMHEIHDAQVHLLDAADILSTKI